MKKIYPLLIISVFISYFASAQVHQLWGTTSSGGGVDSGGTIFKINLDGSSFSVVHYCDDSTGRGPYGSLIQAPNGLLFGTTEDGGLYGAGVIFEYDPGNNQYAHDFDFDYYTSGGYPESSLLLASNDTLYGMASGGGANFYGTIFSFDPNSKVFNDLFDFSDSTGVYPFGYLIQANNGKLYGLTSNGGSDSVGTLFSYTISSNTFSLLHNFTSASGITPNGSLLQALDGKLYGMTSAGGRYGFGVIFSCDLNGNSYNDIYDFNDTAGSVPFGGLIQASDGLLYGLASNGGANGTDGTIFSFDPSINSYTDLFDFDGANGSTPEGELFEASNGLLFGTTNFGGLNDADGGVVFSFDRANRLYTDLHDFNPGDGQNPWGDLIELTTTGIAEHKNVENIQLYPNPANDKTRINSEGLNIQGIDIYDVLGNRVYTQQNRGMNAAQSAVSETTINVSGLAQGVYFIHVNLPQDTWISRFVKE